MKPHLDLLGYTISTYGLMYFVAFVLALALLGRRAREIGQPERYALEGPVVATIAGIVGARIYYLVAHPSAWSHPFDFNGGNAWYGAFAAGFVAIVAWARWRRIGFVVAADAAACCLAVIQAVGRIGCQLAGDGDYGKPSHLPWAMGYPHGTVPTPPGVTVHPTPIYETLALGLIGVWLWRNRDRFQPTGLWAWYLVLAGVERFLVEFVRRNPDYLWGLTAAQLWSAGLVAAGGLWLAALRRRHGSVTRSGRPRAAGGTTIADPAIAQA